MGMAKYDRLLFILNLLRTRRNLTAALIAKECGVTERSIYRDVLALSEANIPIYYHNGYKLASDLFLPALNFDFDEYTCLKLALESSPLHKTGKYDGVLKRIGAKVESGLSQAVKERRKNAVDATHIDIETSIEEKRAARFYGVIERAVSERRCLRLEYDSVESGETSRVVEPHFIIFRGRAFYFVAYCRLRKELRTFRLERVQNIDLLEEHFTPQQGVTPDSYFEGSWELGGGEPVEVVIRFTGHSAKRVGSVMHHPKETKQKGRNGDLVYRVTVRGMEEIQRWVLGFGDEARVLEPKRMRDNLARIGRYYVDTYCSGNPGGK